MEIKGLKVNEDKLRDLYLRKLALGEIQGPSTGYPSQDKPWLKYYQEMQIISSIPEMSAYDYLKECNRDNLDGKAIKFYGKSYTYDELFKMIDKAAEILLSLGVKQDETVVLMLPATPDEVILFYALDKIGACSNFVFPGTPISNLANICNEFSVKKLFIFDAFLQNDKYFYNEVPSLENIVLTGKGFYGEKIREEQTIDWYSLFEQHKFEGIEVPTRDPKKALFIAKTGGTTGKPKNVLLNDLSFNLIVNQYLNSSLEYNKGDKWLRMWPIFSATAAVSSNHLPLCAGMELIIEPNVAIDKLDEVLIKERPNHIPLVPAYLDNLGNSELLLNHDLSFLKTVGFGGMGMPKELEYKIMALFEKFGIKTYLGCGYGMTENASTATIRMSKETAKIGATGVPMVDTCVSVFDPITLEEKKYNEEGEICVLSNTYMLGYYNDEELTKKTLRKHPDGKIWLHSGDLGFVDNDGQVFVRGRMKRVIQTYPSNKIYPSDIEEEIIKIEGVRNVSVVGQPDIENQGYFKPVAFVVAEENVDSKQIYADIINTCKQKFADYSQVNMIYFVQSLPLTNMKKVDVTSLEEEASKRLFLKKK